MAKAVDWYYRRNNCEACEKSDAGLAAIGATAKESADARKVRYDRAAAVKLARGMTTVINVRGGAATTIDLKRDKPSDDALAKALLGPTGNLRAPTIRVGKTLVVGFNPEIWAELLS